MSRKQKQKLDDARSALVSALKSAGYADDQIEDLVRTFEEEVRGDAFHQYEL